ncbi:MAG: DUF1559 domain-containing protein [Gemmataceae bacterium]
MVALLLITANAPAADHPAKALTNPSPPDSMELLATIHIKLQRISPKDVQSKLGDSAASAILAKWLEQLQAGKVDELRIFLRLRDGSPVVVVHPVGPDTKQAFAALQEIRRGSPVAFEFRTGQLNSQATGVDQPPILIGLHIPENLRRVLLEILPDEAEPTKRAIRGFRSADIPVDLSKPSTQCAIQFNDEASAKALPDAAREFCKLLAQDKSRAEILPVLDDLVKLSEIETTGTKVTLKISAETIGAVMPKINVIYAEQKHWAASFENLKHLALAIHGYADAHEQHFPTDVLEANGKPLLSWRVRVLPYMNEAKLFEQFHLDEPWDGPINKKLLDKMPAIFRAPGTTAPTGRTPYLGPSGTDFFWVPGAKVGLRFRDITDGTSNTIMLVEANDANLVEWTKPTDWSPDATDPRIALIGRHRGSFAAGFADGSVRLLPNTIEVSTLKALLTRAGGEVVNLP